MPDAGASPIPALDIDRLTAEIPRGSWVTIDPTTYDRVVGHGFTVEEALAKASSHGQTNPSSAGCQRVQWHSCRCRRLREGTTSRG